MLVRRAAGECGSGDVRSRWDDHSGESAHLTGQYGGKYGIAAFSMAPAGAP